MADRIRVVQVGLGPVGRGTLELILERPSLELVGAVDLDPALVGRDPGELISTPRSTGVVVAPDLRSNLERVPCDVVVITTTSSLEGAAPSILTAIDAKASVVSSCEELSFPHRTHPKLSGEIDQRAANAGVAVLGTGVNPGFLMDFLPVAASGVCRRVDRIAVDRIQNASPRRLPFIQKIGAGLSRADFDARVETGTLRHVGLPESVALIGSAMGWELDDISETLDCVVSERAMSVGELHIQPGMAAGVEQIAIGRESGQERVRLTFKAAVEEPQNLDRVVLHGEPPLELLWKGGVPGDVATWAIVVNAIPRVLKARPGLRTMADFAVPAARSQTIA